MTQKIEPQGAETGSVKSGLSSTLVSIGAVAAILLGLGLWHQSRTRLACNSPELFAAFQKNFEDGKKRHEERMKTATPETQKHYEGWPKLKLVIVSTTTLEREGNFLNCSMEYHHGSPEFTHTFQFILTRNDQGVLSWRFNGYAPYQYFD